MVKVVVGNVYELIQCSPVCNIYAEDNKQLVYNTKVICTSINNDNLYAFITEDNKKFTLTHYGTQSHLKEI